MDIIYWRTKGRGTLVSPMQVLSAYPTINRYHDSWSQTFVRHAEVQLIDYLTSLKRRPSEIGVSKLCCRGCYVWISTVNAKIAQRGGASVWTVSGTHGKNYPWAKDCTSQHWEAEQSVLKDLYDQVTKLLDSLQPLKMDSDDESETGETQRVHSNAADDFKRRHGRSEGSFISDQR
jgi:hypothetical protein